MALSEHDPDWTKSTEEAWSVAIGRLADAMVRGLSRADVEASETVPPERTGPMRVERIEVSQELPVTRYTEREGVSLAYQVLGEGDTDLVLVPGLVSHLEVGWRIPEVAAFQRGLASLARLVVIDPRGVGLSERAPGAFSVDERALDVLHVLEELGSDRAVVLGTSDAAPVALISGALAPERVHGVVTLGGASRIVARGEGEHGVAREVLDARVAEVRARWGAPLFLDVLAPGRAESRKDGSALAASWASLLRAGSSSGALAAQLRRHAELDVRALLPMVDVPALVMHRRGDRFVPAALATELAGALPRATEVVLAGDEHLPFLGDRDALLEALDGFLQRLPRPSGARALRTALVLSGPGARERDVLDALAGVPGIEWAHDVPVARSALLALGAASLALATARGLGRPISVALAPVQLGPEGLETTGFARARTAVGRASPGELVGVGARGAVLVGSGERLEARGALEDGTPLFGR
jgi:pimeloyl-ACP methyl ester carboxylesterase